MLYTKLKITEFLNLTIMISFTVSKGKKEEHNVKED